MNIFKILSLQLFIQPTNGAFVNRNCCCHVFSKKLEIFSSISSEPHLDGDLPSWEAHDDWNSLSEANPSANNNPLSYSLDPARDVAKAIELQLEQDKNDFMNLNINSDEDNFVSDTIDVIHSAALDPNGPALFDTEKSFDAYVNSNEFAETLADEIGLLVRCNESPNDMLVEEGRALPALKDEDKYDVKQLVLEKAVLSNEKQQQDVGISPRDKPNFMDRFEPTPFFSNALSTMFQSYVGALKGGKKTKPVVLTKELIAKWMSKSLGEKVGMYDKRVNVIASRYGTKGVINENQFNSLYMEAATIGLVETKESFSRKKALGRLHMEETNHHSVWRDLKNHGFSPPIVEERQRMQDKLDADFSNDNDENRIHSSASTIMDECEILEWGNDKHSSPRARSKSQMVGASEDTKKSSHEFVELCSDKKTPKRLRDGDFVFIDEDSCIGCKQCVLHAPTTFAMEESGRARTYRQSNTPEVKIAVSTCPVSCMHEVAFDELKEMETFRDVGDEGTYLSGRNAFTPLHVARRNGGLNQKKNIYNYLKQKCYFSHQCPQKGCYNCPMFEQPGENPDFQKKNKAAEKARARDIIDSGEFDMWRKTAEL